MVKLKRSFISLTIFCLVLTLFGGVSEVSAQGNSPSANQFTQMDSINTNWAIDQTIPESYQMTAENETYILYVDHDTLGFKVVDKRSGYVWHSSLDEKLEEDKLNKSWEAFARSGTSINYLDSKAASKRISITNAEHELIVTPIDMGVECKLTFTDFGISLSMILKLEPDGVSIEVPFDSIQETNPSFRLAVLHLYPFFGATRGGSVPGYMFIPDGAGSLIRFADTTKARNMLYYRYYGQDLGMLGRVPWDPSVNPPYIISLPVFGMVHGYKQNAFITVIEEGASYAEIQAHPSGILTNFNFIYNAFIYNQSYFQPTNRAGAGVTTIQQQPNRYDVKMHYRFLTQDESDYVGMAQNYQRYLVDKGILKKTVQSDMENIGIRLEFLGAEKEKVLLWTRSIPVTTISQMEGILKDLQVHNPEVIYYGWQPQGAASMPPSTLKIDNSLGSSEELLTLSNSIFANGGNLYLYYDPQAALIGEGGYSKRYDLAMAITIVELFGYHRGKANNYLNVDALNSNYSSLTQDVQNYEPLGLALDEIGYNLYSDFKSGNFLNREDAIQRYREIIADSWNSLAFYSPNAYMYDFMKAYFDMPVSNSGYIYTTDVVPFLQIVLAGYVPFYGKALNFSSDIKMDLLRHIDFGVYPSYFLTHEPTARFLKTNSNWIYTSAYEQWGQEVKDTYVWMNALLAPVIGEEITSREVLQPGVVATTYANGKQILVNYTDKTVLIEGTTVNALDAAIREVLP